MDVKTKLSELLEEKGMKQADLSRITGIPTSLISNYLKGVKSPSLSNAVVLASALNVTVDDLAGLSGDETTSFKGKGLMIGDKIKKLRKDSNMTQLELSEKLSVTRTVISNWEANINKPNIDLVADMCKIFNISPEYFFETKESSESADPEDLEVVYNILKKAFSDLNIDVSSLTERQRAILQILAELIAQNF